MHMVFFRLEIDMQDENHITLWEKCIDYLNIVQVYVEIILINGEKGLEVSKDFKSLLKRVIDKNNNQLHSKKIVANLFVKREFLQQF